MPVQIGAPAHNFSDPTGLLSDCHRRIEMFLRVLEGVALVIDRPLTGESRSALESALRYFREAAPKHTADEEESLFPRLCCETLLHRKRQTKHAVDRLNPQPSRLRRRVISKFSGGGPPTTWPPPRGVRRQEQGQRDRGDAGPHFLQGAEPRIFEFLS